MLLYYYFNMLSYIIHKKILLHVWQQLKYVVKYVINVWMCLSPLNSETQSVTLSFSGANNYN